MEWVFIWLFCGVISAAIASGKGRSGCGWFLLGILVGPFGFAVALLPRLNKPPDQRGLVKCPFCAELIKAEAVKCRHCGSDIPVSSQTILAGTKKEPDAATKIGYIFLIILGTIIAVALFNVIISYIR